VKPTEQHQLPFALCDLSEFPADWVTQNINDVAADTANSYLTNNIINPLN
jgi:hypothetical protein